MTLNNLRYPGTRKKKKNVGRYTKQSKGRLQHIKQVQTRRKQRERACGTRLLTRPTANGNNKPDRTTPQHRPPPPSSVMYTVPPCTSVTCTPTHTGESNIIFLLLLERFSRLISYRSRHEFTRETHDLEMNFFFFFNKNFSPSALDALLSVQQPPIHISSYLGFFSDFVQHKNYN